MQHWAEIVCQRSHDTHTTRRVTVDLAVEHQYHDYPQVPAHLARTFAMDVYDGYPVDGGPYCPAHDAVSATIVSHGIWEPRETILTLMVCDNEAPGMVVDLGAQIGWFSLLAASCGRDVLAIDADAENLRVLKESATANGWKITTSRKRLGPRTRPLLITDDTHFRLAKLDIEGSEDQGIRFLWPAISEGRVDHLMMEVSPCFDAFYPELVERVVGAGYRAYTLPGKERPPVSLDDPASALGPYRIDDRHDLAALVASWWQEDLWFVREGASW